MEHIWTVLCQRSSIDAETNLISLFNCIEQLDLTIDKSKVPTGNLVIPIEFDLVSFWISENSNKDNLLDVTFELLDPHKKSLHKFANKFSIKKGMLRFRNKTHVQGLTITSAGRYTVNVMQRKEANGLLKIVSEIPLDINITYK